MPSAEAHMRVVIENGDACIAIGNGIRLLRNAIEDLPWRDDLKESLDWFVEGIHGIEVKPCKKG